MGCGALGCVVEAHFVALADGRHTPHPPKDACCRNCREKIVVSNRAQRGTQSKSPSLSCVDPVIGVYLTDHKSNPSGKTSTESSSHQSDQRFQEHTDQASTASAQSLSTVKQSNVQQVDDLVEIRRFLERE